MNDTLAAIVLGALAIQSVLTIWILGIVISNNNKLTKHCASTEGDTADIKTLKQMHGMEQPPMTHPPLSRSN